MSNPLTVTDLVNQGGEMPDTMGNSDAKDTTQKAASGKEAYVAAVNQKYTRWRSDRRPYEATWFLNASLIRGLTNARFNPMTNILEARKTPAHRSRESINIILPKVKAKLSKHLKTRALPVVQASSTDHEDILNASATTKVLEYLWEKIGLEELYEEALLQAMQTGKSFWWFYWDERRLAQVREPANVFGKQPVHDIPLGDVGVEAGSAFEVLVSDPGILRIQKQPEIMRVKTRLTADTEKLFGLSAGSITSDVKEGDLFQYQKQIASLGAKAITGMTAATGKEDEQATYVVVKELFTAPTASFPKGRYCVVAGDKLLKEQDELPYGLGDTLSPYPVVEFVDTLTAGQFWGTTMVEQLAGLQGRFNRVHNQVDESLKLTTHPKIFVPKQANLHPNAWNSEAGEKIPYNAAPGVPHPSTWIVTQPPISGDVWRTIDQIKQDRDELTNLYPASVGAQGATSGFDTNLLQEAADSVHAPDIRRNELALKDAAFKMRRIAKMGYDVPRLISIIGRDKSPDVFEFSSEHIDEHANIVIDTGSALPQSKHARIEAILKMDERQLFGAVGDPTRNRKLLRMLNLGSQEEYAAMDARDEEHARLENLLFTRAEDVEDPMPWENHDLEYEVHTDLLKSPEIKQWAPEQRTALVRHVILHVKFKNPQNAMQLAALFGMQDVLAEIQQTMALQQAAAAPPAGAPPPAPGGPPQGAPSAPPPQAPPQAPPAQ